MEVEYAHNKQKHRRKDVSIECLAIFYYNKLKFSHQFIDEI